MPGACRWLSTVAGGSVAQVVTLLQRQRQGWQTVGVASGWAWPGVRLLEAGQPVFAAHPLHAAHTARFPSRSSNSPPLCAQNQIINTPWKELCFVHYYSCCQEVLAARDPHRLSLHCWRTPSYLWDPLSQWASTFPRFFICEGPGMPSAMSSSAVLPSAV